MLHFGPNIYAFNQNLALVFLQGFPCLFVLKFQSHFSFSIPLQNYQEIYFCDCSLGSFGSYFILYWCKQNFELPRAQGVEDLNQAVWSLGHSECTTLKSIRVHLLKTSAENWAVWKSCNKKVRIAKISRVTEKNYLFRRYQHSKETGLRPWRLGEAIPKRVMTSCKANCLLPELEMSRNRVFSSTIFRSYHCRISTFLPSKQILQA